MAPRLLDGRREANIILAQLKKKVRRLQRQPLLATIQVGRRPDASLYLRLKGTAAQSIGIGVEHHLLPTSVTQAKLEQLIATLNRRRDVTGILLQLPLPAQLDPDRAVAKISPQKDVDGFTVASKVTPPTIAAVLHLLNLAKPKKISDVALIGNDSVFSATLSELLKFHRVAVVAPQAADSPTVKAADVIITASGRGPRLTAKHIQPGAILIDVGIRQMKGKTVGDIEQSAHRTSKAFSPVPGGVGPLTIAFVLKNTVDLAV